LIDCITTISPNGANIAIETTAWLTQ